MSISLAKFPYKLRYVYACGGILWCKDAMRDPTNMKYCVDIFKINLLLHVLGGLSNCLS